MDHIESTFQLNFSQLTELRNLKESLSKFYHAQYQQSLVIYERVVTANGHLFLSVVPIASDDTDEFEDKFYQYSEESGFNFVALDKY